MALAAISTVLTVSTSTVWLHWFIIIAQHKTSESHWPWYWSLNMVKGEWEERGEHAKVLDLGEWPGHLAASQQSSPDIQFWLWQVANTFGWNQIWKMITTVNETRWQLMAFFKSCFYSGGWKMSVKWPAFTSPWENVQLHFLCGSSLTRLNHGKPCENFKTLTVGWA